MIWLVIIFLIIFWGWCLYDLINAPVMPEDFTNEAEDFCDEQYFITRKDEEDGVS